MDRVRLGRALGYGTRHAAKTLAAVAEAATASDPRRPASPESAPSAIPAVPPAEPRPPQPRPRPTATQVRGASKSFLAPLATFSSALWLRVTGTFFGVIALAMASGAWRLRGVLRSGALGSTDAKHFWIFIVFAGLFGYFAVTGFLRANLRERRGSQQTAR